MRLSELYHLNAAGTGDDATAYDNLNRIENMRRGTLSSSGYNGTTLDTVTTLNSTTGLTGNSQSWTLDNVGTWSSVTTDGTAANRTNNAQNEIATAGSSTLTYDNNGNMTTSDNGDTVVYNAWNQVTIEKTGGTTNLTITRTATGQISTYNNGNLSDFFQDAAGQLIEFGTTTVHEDYVWGQAYVNEEVLRDRDYDGNHGTGNYGAAGSGLEERVYDQYDANYDTTSIFATGGTSLGLQERIVYGVYGASQQLDGSWNVSTDPHHWYWNFKYQGEWQESFGNMYAMGAREYNFTTGTWMQKDPTGTGDGVDLYQMERGDPSGLLDPTGERAQLPFFPIITAPIIPPGLLTGFAAFNPALRASIAAMKAPLIAQVASWLREGLVLAPAFMTHFFLGGGLISDPLVLTPAQELTVKHELLDTIQFRNKLRSDLEARFGATPVNVQTKIAPNVARILSLDYTTDFQNRDLQNAFGSIALDYNGSFIRNTDGSFCYALSFNIHKRYNFWWYSWQHEVASTINNAFLNGFLLQLYGICTPFSIAGSFNAVGNTTESAADKLQNNWPLPVPGVH